MKRETTTSYIFILAIVGEILHSLARFLKKSIEF